MLGIASALTMQRGPARARIVALVAVALWLTLLGLHALVHVDPNARGPRWRRGLSLVRRSSLTATQSATQLTLFFAWPFYLHAATREPLHIVFMLGLGMLSAATLWDPWSEWLITHRALAPLLPATGSFVALNAVLPGLGLSTHASLRIAAAVAAIGVALQAAVAAGPGRRLSALSKTLGFALVLPLALELGGARCVPAAPLRLVKIEIGTRLEGREVADPSPRLHDAPARLFCATAIASPVGVRDRLFHVWRYGGVQRSRIDLDIRGGRELGFRTFSRIDHFGAHPAGVYSCSVETESGQTLGSASVRIDSPRG